MRSSSPILGRVAAGVIALAASPVNAGVSFTVRTTVRADPGARAVARLGTLTEATLRGWADRERGKVEVMEGRNPAVPKGAVLLTLDAGRTVRLYDRTTRTCRPWMPAPSGGMPAGVAPRNLAFEKTLEEDGPKTAGLPTRHYRLTVRYDTGSGTRPSHTERVEDLWVASSLSEPGLAVWLGVPLRTGSAEVDRRLAAAIESLSGTIIRRESTVRSAREGQPFKAITTVFEVKSLSRPPSVADATFAEPFPCKAQTPEEQR